MTLSKLLLAGSLMLALSSTIGLRAQETAGDTKSSPPKKQADRKNQDQPPASEKMVTVNHKGKVITVDSHALKAHLAHGDTVVADSAAPAVGDAGSGADTNAAAAAKSDKGRSKKKGATDTAPAVSGANTGGDTNAAAGAKSGKGRGKKKGSSDTAPAAGGANTGGDTNAATGVTSDKGSAKSGKKSSTEEDKGQGKKKKK